MQTKCGPKWPCWRVKGRRRAPPTLRSHISAPDTCPRDILPHHPPGHRCEDVHGHSPRAGGEGGPVPGRLGEEDTLEASVGPPQPQGSHCSHKRGGALQAVLVRKGEEENAIHNSEALR